MSMLGRVLDEAAAQEKLLVEDSSDPKQPSGASAQPTSSNERSSLLRTSGTSDNGSNSNLLGPSNKTASNTKRPATALYGSTTGVAGPASLSSTTSSNARRPRRDSHAENQSENDDGTFDDDDDDDETLEDYDDEDNNNKAWGLFGYCQQCWNCLRVVADVENVWDSPSDSSNLDPSRRRQKSLILAFWFIVLATSYAGERSTFKFLVDQAGPFRLFSVEMVTAVHAILLGIGLLISYILHRKQVEEQRRRSNSSGGFTDPLGSPFELPLGLPVVDVGLMALLDVVSLMLVFLTGIYVSPTLTVILVQFVLPLTAFFMQFVHPHGRFSCCRPMDGSSAATSTTSPCLSTGSSPSGNHGHTRNNSRGSNYSMGSGTSQSPQEDTHMSNYNNNNINFLTIPSCAGLAAEHLWGSALIFCACIFALIPSFYTIIDPDFFRYADPIPLRVAYNSLFFLSACVPAAASQLYKEHVFLQYKQPVNVHKVNLLLSVFQFVFVSVLSPLVFTLQGLGSEDAIWYTLYPSSDFSENFVDGLSCFFWLLDDEDQETKYPEKASCDWVLPLTIIHAICIILVGTAVDKIVSAGSTKITHRGISAGIILAVVGMAIYDFHIPQFSYGPFVDGLTLLCLIMLILGSEIYHRVSMPESTFETIYPTLENIYDDE